jgi:hypothetical protein
MLDELETTKRELETTRRELETMRRKEETIRRMSLAMILLFLIFVGSVLAGLGIAYGFWWGYLFAAATFLLIVIAWLLRRWLVQRPRPSK